MNSMVTEFKKQEDIQQACYEATVDLSVFVEHIEGIARRCERNFPHIAAGLRGSAAGIARYLRGVDGKWETPANEGLRAVLDLPDFHQHMWAYEFCRDPRAACILFGAMAAVAGAQPQLRFWDALGEARSRLGNLETLIDELLASSPLRRAQ